MEPGETKTVTMPLKHEQMSYFNEQTNTCDEEEGSGDIYVAASSADVRLTGKINTEAATVKTTYKSAPTGIQDVTNNLKLQNDRIYNISGYCVGTVEDFERLPKGFYIVGNKKVIKQ